MADIGIKKNVQQAIIAALLKSPLLALLNTSEGAGVYASERIETRDGYSASIGPCILVEMPEASAHDSVGPATMRATMTSQAYVYFSEENDKTADEFCSLVTSALRVCLANAGRDDAVAKVGGYSNCFTVDDVGWMDGGQDKVYAVSISFLSSWPSKVMVTT